jgi:hypothetical protein
MVCEIGISVLAAVTSTAVIALLLGLGHCFLGYVLFRITLAIDAMVVGWMLGGAVAALFREPSPTDLFVAGVVGAVILAMLAWLLFRMVFALGAGAAVALLVATAFGEPVSTGAWVAGIIIGLIVAVICYAEMRKLVVLVTAIGGAMLTVAAGGALLADLPWHPARWITTDITGVVALAATLGLAVAGVLVQRASPFFLTDRYSPDQRRGRGRGGRVKPRFTKG